MDCKYDKSFFNVLKEIKCHEEAKTMNTGSQFHKCLCPLITKTETSFSLDCADTNHSSF